MKNITLVLGICLMIAGTFQTNAQDRNLETILERLKVLSNLPITIDAAIKQNFNANEKATLNSHFDSLDSSCIFESRILVNNFLAENIRGAQKYGVVININGPYDLFPIADPLGHTLYAGDFARDGTLYGLTFLNNQQGEPLYRQIISINEIGDTTIVGDILTALNGEIPTGLSYDFTTDQMYACTSNRLFQVDLINGTITEVGPITGTSGGVIWLEIDNNGIAYSADIIDDSLYTIDLATGTATLVGQLNVPIGFAQDASVDPDTNILYMAAFLTSNGMGRMYEVNVSTGGATLLGPLGAGFEQWGMLAQSGEPILGLDENLLTKINIYPNPTKNLLEVKIPSTLEVINVSLFDLIGKNTNVQLINGEMNLSSLRSGVYILHINTTDGKVTEKIVKQ